ncbi:MAG: DUF2249 domain-containing protein [Rhodopseudomonas palustris]|uniref:DUF2249 domain-containing protein n=1 Tax=Rhodopseudomonas palustris TaxID=1076 RepID=A0A933S100_RHOPL|nr:DUF2249 domain-containing protein [Rhodopseudomonas palustris]
MTSRSDIPASVRSWQTGEGLHVDVRGLPCPEPLVTLLRLIDGGSVRERMFAHLGQEPLLLYPELDARGWRSRLVASAGDSAAGDDHVVLEIVRGTP